MIRAVIADDEAFAREQIKFRLKKNFPQITVVGEAHDGREAVQSIRSHKPDLVFLDIKMPHLDGFEVLGEFSAIDFDTIFITAFDEFAIKALRFSALDYLLKPVKTDEFANAINRFLEKRKHHTDRKSMIKNLISNFKAAEDDFKLTVSTSEGIHFLKTGDIVRCEADVNYTSIFLKEKKKIFTSRTLKDYEDLLTAHDFLRVHKSHLVNTNYILNLNKAHQLLLSDGSLVEVSRRKLPEVKEFIGRKF